MTFADESPTVPSIRRSRVVAASLRVFGGIDLLAVVAVLMPVEWMQLGHRVCGMGEFPAGPLPEYLSRSTSLLWAMHGALLWYLSTNVELFAGVIRFVARITVVGGCVWLAIDLWIQLPWWWIALEGPVFAASGLWLLWWMSPASAPQTVR